MYISPIIQKELLIILASNVWGKILKGIGDATFCIFVDEPLGESYMEK